MTATANAPPLTKHDLETRPERPPMPETNWQTLPREMWDYKQWVVWRWEWRDGRGWTKVPRHVVFTRDASGCELPHTEWGSSTDPATWNTFDEATTWLEIQEFHCAGNDERRRYGIGFVLTKDDPFCVIDPDDTRNRNTGELKGEAPEIVRRFPTYAEVSPSGTGVKVILQGNKPTDEPGGRPRCKNTERNIEIYEDKRFIALTGNILPGAPSETVRLDEELAEFYCELFPPPHKHGCSCGDCADKPRLPLPPLGPLQPLRGDLLTDQDVIDRAGRARNGDRFLALWHGDWSAYASRSEADLALAGMLAFWTGPDAGRIIALMERSGLRREKWRTHAIYLAGTVDKIVGELRTWYGDGSWRPTPITVVPTQGSDGAAEDDHLNLAPEMPLAPFRPWDCHRAHIRLASRADPRLRLEIGKACGAWGCLLCHEWRKTVTKLRLKWHLENSDGFVIGGKVHIGEVKDFDLRDAGAHIFEHGGRRCWVRSYNRMRAVSLRLFVSTVCFPGSCEVSVEDALTLFNEWVDAVPVEPHKDHPVWFCPEWPALPEMKDKPSDNWNVLGNAMMSLRRQKRLLDVLGVVYWEESRITGERLFYKLPTHWDEEDVWQFDEWVYNDVMPSEYADMEHPGRWPFRQNAHTPFEGAGDFDEGG